MSYKARWGPMGFLVSPSKVVPFDGFTTSVGLKAETQKDASGSDATNARGRELQSMTFTTKYIKALGVNPRKAFESWDAELGNVYPLYIGEKRFGPAKMMLTNVDISETLMDDRGDFLAITLNITLQEYSPVATTTAKSEAADKAAATYAATVAQKEAEKSAAMNATASADDKMAAKL